MSEKITLLLLQYAAVYTGCIKNKNKLILIECINTLIKILITLQPILGIIFVQHFFVKIKVRTKLQLLRKELGCGST